MCCFAIMSPRSIFFASSTSCGAVRSACLPASRRKSCSASVVVSTGCAAAGWGGGAGSFSGLFHDELDASAVELRVHRLDLEWIELQRLEQFDQVLLAQLPIRLCSLEQRCELLVDEDGLDLDGQRVPPDLIRVCLASVPRLHTTQTRLASLNQVSRVRRNSRRSTAAVPAAPATAMPTTFVVTQVRHAPQHAWTAGARRRRGSGPAGLGGSCARTWPHSRPGSRLIVAVHGNVRYVKLEEKGPFPRLGCGA